MVGWSTFRMDARLWDIPRHVQFHSFGTTPFVRGCFGGLCPERGELGRFLICVPLTDRNGFVGTRSTVPAWDPSTSRYDPSMIRRVYHLQDLARFGGLLAPVHQRRGKAARLSAAFLQRPRGQPGPVAMTIQATIRPVDHSMDRRIAADSSRPSIRYGSWIR